MYRFSPILQLCLSFCRYGFHSWKHPKCSSMFVIRVFDEICPLNNANNIDSNKIRRHLLQFMRIKSMYAHSLICGREYVWLKLFFFLTVNHIISQSKTKVQANKLSRTHEQLWDFQWKSLCCNAARVKINSIIYSLCISFVLMESSGFI